MVEDQLRRRGIRHEAVLSAMADVPRHEFVPSAYREMAYTDQPLPIGRGQTISQPYMVASMTQALEPTPADCVLEVGTGSGYQAAVLARIVARVTTVEWFPELAETARKTLERLGISNATVLTGDGSLGVEGESFDGIIITAGIDTVPPPLLEQLGDGGRLVIPRGSRAYQTLTVIRRTGATFKEELHEGCVFVPLQGPYGWTS
jgi:protein-L-isoaspartate(D-aspartate) O-methyltransferase